MPPSSARNQAPSTGTGIDNDLFSTDDDIWMCVNCEKPWDEHTMTDGSCGFMQLKFHLLCFGDEYQTKNLLHTIPFTSLFGKKEIHFGRI